MYVHIKKYYQNGYKLELKHQFQQNSCTGIEGPSGIGKTTLLRILAGHLEPNDGCVAIDGFERSLWDRHRMTAQSAFVLQNDQMFQGTITENISAFSMAPDMARVRTAARSKD